MADELEQLDSVDSAEEIGQGIDEKTDPVPQELTRALNTIGILKQRQLRLEKEYEEVHKEYDEWMENYEHDWSEGSEDQQIEREYNRAFVMFTDEMNRVMEEINQIVINVIGKYARMGYAEAIAYQEENHVPMEWR